MEENTYDPSHELVDPGKRNDPAFQAVNEGGGGVSEGFELAEEALIENAEHGELTAPWDSFDEEEYSGAEYSEADSEEDEEDR